MTPASPSPAASAELNLGRVTHAPGDVEGLVELGTLAAEVDRAVTDAVTGRLQRHVQRTRRRVNRRQLTDRVVTA
jgi:hypothetical protein